MNRLFSQLTNRFLLVITGFFLLVIQANATDIYLAQTASGSGDGSSWDNAKAGSTYLNSLSGTTLPSETHIYMKAGSYTYTGTALIRMGFNNTIQGGYPASATGTDKSGYNPIANQTNITLNQSTAGYRYFLTTSGPGTGTGMDANSTIILKGLRFFGQQVSSYNDGIFNAGNGSGHGSSPGTFKGIDLYVEGYQGGASAFQFNGNVGGSGAVYFTNTVFNNNSAASMGGAIYMNSNTNATLYIDKCSFTGNENLGPLSVAAGAIWSFSPVTITNSYFCNNKAAYAGGALGNQNTGGAPMSWNISNTVFYNNQATNAGGQGGAIFAGQGSLILNGCSFYNNTAGSAGGAIYKGQTTFNYPTTSINNCLFYNNGCTAATNFGSQERGGGALIYVTPNSNFPITNTKFVNNYSQPGGSNSFGSGGAIKLGNNSTASNYKMTLDNCLFSGNYFGASSSASTTTTWGADFAATVKNSGGQAIFEVKSTTKVQLGSAAAYTADPAYATYPGSAPYTFESGVTYNNTDNGGVTGFTGSCPTSINAVAVNVTGQVWDDVNGNVTLDGGENGTNAGGPLFVNLIDAAGTVVASTTVSASGSYTLTAPASTTGLKLVLTSSASSTTPGTLPSQWVNTGESAGPGNSASQSSTLGQIELNTATTDATAQNFGIEHLPTPGSGTATVSNSGGTSPVSVPPTAFTNTVGANDTGDTPPGSVTAIHLTSFPTNATSLTINGTVYTSLPAGGITIPTDGNGSPTVPILVDPTNDSNPVVFTYTAIDNAGKESTTTGTATLNFLPTITVSGQVWDDVNGNVMLDGLENGTNAGGPLYVNLIDATGTVVASTTVSATGSYTLTGVPTNATGLKLVLTNSATSATPGTLPSQWVNTGENVGPGNPASQSSTLGQIELSTGTSSVTAQNFGIEHLPTPGSGANTVPNAGGTSPVTVPANTFTNITSSNDNGDTPPGSVTAIKLTSFPTNVTSLTINGTVYTSLPAGGITIPADASGAPIVPILVDPTNDSNPVVFTYTAIDNAGKESTTTGMATINSSLALSVSGNVFDDANGLTDNLVNGTAVNGTVLPVYVSLVHAGAVVATVAVQPNGTYSFSNVSPGSYSLVLTTNSAGSTSSSLPTSWSSTGENLGAGTGSDGTPNGILPVTITATTTNANFGIDQLPTANPVSQTYTNPGGTNQVQAPTLKGSDPEDGTYSGTSATNTVVINSLPASTSTGAAAGTLFYNGTPVSVGDVISNYDPTLLTYDPVDGPGSYTFAYSEVDAAGLASVPATATMIFTVAVPDLTPIIYARPSSVYNTTPVTVVVDVVEVLGVPTSGTVVVRLTKDSKVNLNFDPSATSLNNHSVQNSVWSLDASSNVNYYILTTTAVVAAGDKLSFGFSGTLSPGSTTGTLTLSAVIMGGSGGEVRTNNNADADKIDYFQQ